jgi:hypothetical protein
MVNFESATDVPSLKYGEGSGRHDRKGLERQYGMETRPDSNLIYQIKIKGAPNAKRNPETDL